MTKVEKAAKEYARYHYADAFSQKLAEHDFLAGSAWKETQMLKKGDIIIECKVGMHGEPIEIVLDKYAQRARGIFPGDELTIILRTKR